jgi:hypothetical protein
VTPVLSTPDLARLYAGVDVVVAGPDGSVAARARRCGTTVVTELRTGRLRDELRRAGLPMSASGAVGGPAEGAPSGPGVADAA